MKYISLCIALVIIAHSINAQFARFGVKGGTLLSFPDISPSHENGDYPHYGFLFGIHADLAINKKFTTRLELDFVDKSYNYGSNFFLDFPVNFIYNIPSRKNKFLLGAGPVLGIRTGEDLGYKRTDLGINVLGGYEFAIGFSINLNYTHGFVNMFENVNNNNSLKNRVAGITVGYLF